MFEVLLIYRLLQKALRIPPKQTIMAPTNKQYTTAGAKDKAGLTVSLSIHRIPCDSTHVRPGQVPVRLSTSL